MINVPLGLTRSLSDVLRSQGTGAELEHSPRGSSGCRTTEDVNEKLCDGGPRAVMET